MDPSNNSAPERRFSNRVENYVRYRPSYPSEIPDRLAEVAGLTPDSIVADIGSGTGISTELFLKFGCAVYGVEPNADMRGAAEHMLAGYPKFHSIDGKAQATTLPDQSVDFIIAAQAFHWFENAETRAEFSHIMKPNAKLGLLWNKRQLDTTPFLRDYEEIMTTYGSDYSRIRHENIDDERLAKFFIGPFDLHTFQHRTRLDFESLKGLALSSSSSPLEGHPNHEPMMRRLQESHARHQIDGSVEMIYTTKLYVGS
ncbi:class I SAM-dependent methyltransferase [Luteolibacter pohnpeiensis]|uniref:Class I SAM-dependent methyltransferase n=1 Tax=Luteolibacter pohnpeiensis TaxID=454153 RepID=A0A934S1S0_9BACT|nr:class I SAM-dependent methyltransferase [Luteolibacter pohnpeiensis]MBK1881635.1 class I SAM-dependent methyltransferase [Luteolibacter pohnpeiensis]